jgi:hypothetical protein
MFVIVLLLTELSQKATPQQKLGILAAQAFGPKNLEEQFQSKLNNPRIAGAGHSTEVCLIQEPGVHAIQVGMVKDICGLDPELQAHAFANPGVLSEGCVQANQSRALD